MFTKVLYEAKGMNSFTNFSHQMKRINRNVRIKIPRWTVLIKDAYRPKICELIISCHYLQKHNKNV